MKNKQEIQGYSFAMIYEWVLTSGVSPRSIQVYCLLNRYSNSEGIAWPSHATLAKKIRTNSRTVARCVGELENIGALSIRKRYREDGSQTSSIYVMWPMNVTPTPPDKNVTPPLTKMSLPPLTKMSPHERESMNIKKKNGDAEISDSDVGVYPSEKRKFKVVGRD